MTLKTYQASTMAQALAEVKRDLGRDAVILHTRTFRRGGLLGFWRRRIWEVTASPNLNVPHRMAAGAYEPTARGADEAPAPPAKAAVALTDGAADADSPREAPGRANQPAQAPLATQVQDIRAMLEQLLQRPGAAGTETAPAGPVEVGRLHKQLVEQDIDPALAEQMLKHLCMNLTGQQLADRKALRAEVRKALTGQIRTCASEPARPKKTNRPRVISLIGPTGVGKTTTIAKLAANYKLREGRAVGLITIDTYRIAAVDQLRTYADIIEVPLKAVLTAGELNQAIESMKDLDVVLIDTAGRSQNNRLRLSQLKSFIAAGEPEEVHLVVSATANRACTRTVLERFMPLGANRIIVTKLDEAGSFGVFLTVSQPGGAPVSYVTTGQDVPEDIAAADADSLAQCILTGRFGVEGYGG